MLENQTVDRTTFDLILIGAGLANGLLAIKIHQLNPQKKILILEKQPRLMEAKTWSCHGSDLESFPWASELMSATWPGYEIRFPQLCRNFESAYHSLQPRHLHMKLSALPNVDLKFEQEVLHSDENTVTLASQVKFKANCVIDSSSGLSWKDFKCGFQKFVGLHVELAQDHGMTVPILMDATVPQRDGFRFFYVLPLGRRELLIEDTCFSENSNLEIDNYTDEIQKYAHSHRWEITRRIQIEKGVLPLPLNSNVKSPLSEGKKCALNGMSAGFFHPVTGYSLPDAVRLADRLGQISNLTTEIAKDELKKYESQSRIQKEFLFFLNRMMFQASSPEQRYKILERFYILPEGLIHRFYRGQMTVTDRIRILLGRPPVPVHKALQCIFPGDPS